MPNEINSMKVSCLRMWNKRLTAPLEEKDLGSQKEVRQAAWEVEAESSVTGDVVCWIMEHSAPCPDIAINRRQ